MNGFILFLAVLLGIVVVFLIIAVIIYFKLKKSLSSLGYGTNKKIIEMIREGEEEAKYRHKSVSGLSSILIPKIKRDFPNFNEQELYNKVETSIIGILNTLSNNKVSSINELSEIRSNLETLVQSRVASEIKENYEDIKFHKHAIKDYKNESGVLMITINSSLEYYYEKNVNGKVKIPRKDYKKQTTFTSTFVYIYDPDKYNISKSSLSVHCPNCSAPLKNIETRVCEYCGNKVDDINLRSWYITKYKENF